MAQPALKRAPKRLLVAVSGGADSVALLRAAAAVAPALGWELSALHCDHGLRAASKAEAAFVDALCQRLGLSLYAYKDGIKKGPGVEERARHWRRACYDHAALRSGARLILLAHHAQDQAETLLLNLVRGAGEDGAKAMRPLGPLAEGSALQVGRPFLHLDPQELRAYLKRLKQPWKEDLSNQDTTLARNRVRHQVLPQLAGVNPKAVQNLAAFAARAQAGRKGQDLAGLLKLSSGARRRAQAVLSKGHGQADLERGWKLRLSGGQAEVAKTDAAGLALTAGDSVRWNGWSIQLKLAVPSARNLRDGNAFWFSPELAGQALRLRAARPGERLEAFGLQGSKLVRDLLAEAKVPAWQRPDWPVFESGGRLLAVLGVRRGRGFEAQAGKKALCLTAKAPF